MFCGNCGREISDQAKFCPGCGQPVEQEPDVQEPVTAQDQEPTYPEPDSYTADPYQTPGADTSATYTGPEMGYEDPTNGGYAMPDGYGAPGGYPPQNNGDYGMPGGYPSQSNGGYGVPGGYPSQDNGAYGAPGGYPPQNNGAYGAPGGYPPQNNGGYGMPSGYAPQNNSGYTPPPVPNPSPVVPGKKGSKGVIIGIIAGAVVLIAAVVTLLIMMLSGNNSSSSSNSGVTVLPSSQSESSTPSSQPSDESSESSSESSESSSSQPSTQPSDVPQDSYAETIFQSFIGFPCDYTSTKDDVQSALENVGYSCSWETDDHLTGSVSDGRNLNGYEVVQVDVYFQNGYFIGGELIFINYGDGDEAALLDSIRGQFQSIQTAGYGYSLEEESDTDGVYFTDDNGTSAWGAAVFHETDTDYGFLYCQFGEINWCNSNY